ncbi:MAG: Regulator of RpoS [Anaerolineales bacterium]|nr:response regulator [Anaerolineae bacterium]MBL8105337.1 response regulator [Anaerolineales bacterium]MBV6402808.1 Regulator of RpoS [Anaerolineales bacterium]MCC7188104.1 response regulator [Anaerolineales bacterium]HQU35479.1 response regulator [Anaerolineales bacterium]
MAEAKSKILIVEDDLDIAEMLNAYFRVQGYEVFTVNWGEDGVRAAQTVLPNLIILDIRLPDIDGFEVARRVREDRRTNEIPIIFLTEKRDRSDILQGLEVGADDYITKPFDVQELRLRVRNSLKRVSQASLTNPVSGLPEGALVDEKLSDVVHKSGLSLLHISIANLQVFREAYGFVASDDVLRAISLMISNALKETGSADDFLGHISPSDFVVVLSPETRVAFQEKINSRLQQSLDYFYPLNDREQASKSKNRLAIRVSEVPAVFGKYSSVEQLKKELLSRSQ